MSKINLIIKPTEFCNLRCKYCYNNYSEYKKELLGEENLKKVLSVVARSYDEVVIIWHGGEPSSAGLDYYKRAVEIEKSITFELGTKFDNRMQSNGTLFDEKWVEFIKENSFKIGISFDGIHNDAYRGGTEKTLKTMELFKKNGIRFSSMAVVADGDYDLIANYEYFKEKRIPIEFSYVLPEGAAKSLKHYSAEKYAASSIELFEHWLADKDGVSVRTFVSYINLALGGPALICDHASCHGKYLCINSDGSLYNCSRQSIHEYCIGNIADVNSMEDIFASEGFKTVLRGSIQRRSVCKESCEYFPLCKGGCADVAICEGALDTPPKYNCLIFKTVFGHVKARLEEIFEKKTPLSEFNPFFRDAIIKCLGVREDYSLK
ncbi:MAG: radical SAM protein [Clostridia bacterium]|nr:radical SAM protein [Clostridia bacterium]